MASASRKPPHLPGAPDKRRHFRARGSPLRDEYKCRYSGGAPHPEALWVHDQGLAQATTLAGAPDKRRHLRPNRLIAGRGISPTCRGAPAPDMSFPVGCELGREDGTPQRRRTRLLSGCLVGCERGPVYGTHRNDRRA
ncbi:hypothetical protein GCM10020218_059580 [Dactylosporangium vinaceum]